VPTYVAFLRAVNISPRWVKMARVNALLPEHGYAEVATHIQSGNLRVTTPERSAARVAAHLRTVLSEEFGFDIPVMVRTPQQLRRLVKAIGALEPPTPESRCYVTFLDAAPTASARELLHAWPHPGERAAVLGADVVWWIGAAMAKAKVSNAAVEKIAGAGTTRDVKVVRTLADKWGG
jgi:uncharacterized protein (DUF1697 family)